MKKVEVFEIPKKLKEFCEINNIRIKCDIPNPSRIYLIRLNDTMRNPYTENLLIVLIKAYIVDGIRFSMWTVIKEPKICIDFVSAKNREVLIRL